MFVLTIVLLLFGAYTNAQNCDLPTDLVKEIQSYKDTVDKIIEATTKGKFKGKTYDELSYFVDKFGARQAGGEILEQSIDYLLDLFVQPEYGLENVHGENVTVSHWVRGVESGKLISPRQADIPVLAVGGSVSTPEGGIEAEAVVFKDFDELAKNSNSVKGKIVVFNNEWEGYGKSVAYRTEGPSKAAQYGAIAVLIRSVASFSLSTLHTGQTEYDEAQPKIPAACITVEHARLLQRYQDRNEKIVLKLRIENENLDPTISRNTVAEIQGSTNPEKVVLVSGHLDSWDVGVGAMDDGGGAFISWYSLVVLKALGLRPKRTVRAVLWTSEETGLNGAQAYYEAHKNELDNFILLLESDEGTFTPSGLVYVAGVEGGCILEEILKLLAPINTTIAESNPEGVGSDITIWKDDVPTAALRNDNDKYFWYHHTAADTMDVLDPEALDKATALWASVAYIIADLKKDFPRDLPSKKKNDNDLNNVKPTAVVV